MNDKLTTYKFFNSPEKEEAWLEQMALRGWFFTRVNGFYAYTFHKGQPEARAYKIDYRTFRSAADSEDYLALFKDSGWEPVMPREMNMAFYFYSRQDGARRDIFSDDVSRAQRNLRYATLSAWSMFPAFVPLLTLYLIGSLRPAQIVYLTPGLWQMTGREFIFHFLFETPFVLLRASAYILPVVPLVMVLIFLARYYLLYRKAVKEQAL